MRIFKSLLYNVLGGSNFDLKHLILIDLFWSFSISLKVMVLFWPHTWRAYLNIESNIAKYTVLRRSGLMYISIYLNFARRPQLLLSLLLICSVWNFHVRPSSKSMPRYFISLIVSIFCPLILKLRFLVILLFFVRNKIISVL